VVAQGRSLEESAVRELATGEVFTATRGKELGLVDDFGGFAEALDIAAQLGDARPRPPVGKTQTSLFRKIARPGEQPTGGYLRAS